MQKELIANNLGSKAPVNFAELATPRQINRSGVGPLSPQVAMALQGGTRADHYSNR